MARLVLLQGGEAKPYELDRPQTVLGRHPECDIQLQSNMVSRRHAQIEQAGEDYFLEDLNSGNGTFLNGKRVKERVKLSHRDRIKMGPVLLRFEDEGKPSRERFERLAGSTAAFSVDITPEESLGSTIVGTVGHAGGYGMLDVRPEAKLQGVLEISRSLAGSADLKSLLPKILDTLFRIFPKADRGCILLKDEESGAMQVAAQRHRQESRDETVRISRTVLKKVLEEKTGILSADASSDSRFEASESISSLTIRSVMCVPMLDLNGEPMGIINLDSQNPANRFNKEDVDLLMAVAGQAALSYESARLLISHLEKQRQDSELQIARNVQRSLLPAEFPEVEGYRFYASYHSALAVGGDYYNILNLPEGKICVAFGDVAGKGVPGALVMSRLASVVETTMAFTDDVAEAVAAINNHLCSRAAEGRFVTFVLAVIDTRTHEMTLVNAGHMSPLIRTPEGNVEMFHEETIGIPIGIAEDYPYDVVRRTLQEGETVVIVTDGVDEAMNPAGELYTKERVEAFVRSASPDPRELGEALLQDVRRHAAGRPQNDDITIMSFGRLNSSFICWKRSASSSGSCCSVAANRARRSIEQRPG